MPSAAMRMSGWAPRLMLTILAPPTLSKTFLSIASKSTSESKSAMWYSPATVGGTGSSASLIVKFVMPTSSKTFSRREAVSAIISCTSHSS